MRFSLLIALLILGSCASSQRRHSEVQPLPVDLPKDLVSKFEVQEVLAPEPTPSPSSSPTTTQKKTAPKKTAKKGKAEPKPFVYPNRRPQVDPLWVGEKMVLEITYFGMAAGDFTTEILPFKTINGRKVYHLKAYAKSSAVFNLFYRLDDWLESYMDYEGLFSHRFHLVLNQTKQQRDALELFDSEKKQVYYWDRKDHITKGKTENKEYVPMAQFPQDSYSAIHYLRTLPLEVGKVYTFPVVSEGKSWEAVITVVRKEMLDTPLGKIQTIVVRPQTRFQGVMKQQKGDSFIWLSDDDRRFVMRLEAEVKVGTVVARLKKVERGEKPE